MKTGRTRTLLIVLTLIVILAGCGKDNSQATEVPADLVSEIAGGDQQRSRDYGHR